MPKIAEGIRKKWWFNWIRGINYFAFRFWWLIWLLFIAVIIALLLCCLYGSRKNDLHSESVQITLDRIANKLNECCDCNHLRDHRVVDCPDRELVFQICNSNMLVDDNFEVILNDVSIGSINLNSDQQVGSVFIASRNSNITLGEADFSCPVGNMKIYYFDPSIVRFGSNRIQLKNVQNNRNNNEGTIGIRNYLNVSNVLKDPCVVEDLTFGFESGKNFEVDFNYTQCCE